MSLIDINEEVGMKAINQLKNEYKAFDRVLFVKCDVTDKNEFEGINITAIEIIWLCILIKYLLCA